ncbi:hypothetical protein D9758_012292 [Tetrapyrgos nigripes]|uniref:MYND-type domain-containing protein n=1 Tax=Tetrapyrgos nigripes TaxID=182062 RepID=A0A8H5CIU4_9AGAR|nr:hypothetical protein D9758_012292 [Tetrapyrgos nigripes]
MVSFEYLKASAKRSADSLQQLGDAVRTADDFWDAIPIFMRHIPSQHPESVDLSKPPDSSLIFAVTSLSSIARCLTRENLVTERIQRSICRNWPRIWSCLSFLNDAYTKSPALHEKVAEFQTWLTCVTSYLIYGVTSYAGIVGPVLKTPGVIQFIVDLFYRTAQTSMFDTATTKICLATLEHLLRISDWTSTYYPTFLETFEKVDVNLAPGLIQGLVLCAESKKMPITELSLGLRVYTMAINFSTPLRRTCVAQYSVYWMIAIFRKLINYRYTQDEFSEVIVCLGDCIIYLDSTFHARGHTVVADALGNRLLLLMLRLVPLFFTVLPDDPLYAGDKSRGAHGVYFQLLEDIGVESVSLSVLRALSKSWREIEKRGYYKQFLQGSPKQVQSRWLQFKEVVEERLALKDRWEEEDRLNPCSQCGSMHEGTKKMYRCSQCQISYFCSKRCQKSNWEEHREVCQELYNFRMMYRTPCLDKYEQDFRMFLIAESLRKHEKDMISDEKAYRTSNPSLSPHEPVIHVHHFYSVPMQREVLSIEEATKFIPEEPWLQDPDVLTGTHGMFLASFRKPFRSVEYIVTKRDLDGHVECRCAVEQYDDRTDTVTEEEAELMNNLSAQALINWDSEKPQ